MKPVLNECEVFVVMKTDFIAQGLWDGASVKTVVMARKDAAIFRFKINASHVNSPVKQNRGLCFYKHRPL